MGEVVIVSGAPGAGKSTLAVPLARELGFPLLSKDIIKETLFDQLGHVDPDERASSKRLGAASMELLWRFARDFPRVLLEANFRSQSEHERKQLQALAARPVEVYCSVPVELAAERYARRGSSPRHHQVHVAHELPRHAFEEFQRPFELGPVIEVDTTTAVDIGALAAEVSSLLSP